MHETSSLATHSLGNRSRTISPISTATDSTDFVTCSETFTIILHVFLYIYICVNVYTLFGFGNSRGEREERREERGERGEKKEERRDKRRERRGEERRGENWED